MASGLSARIVSIQVGLPSKHGEDVTDNAAGGAWFTGFYKKPVAGPVAVHPTNLAGDGQADLRVHGGPDKAVLAYSFDHYSHWQAELALNDFPTGAFGENLTLSGVHEANCCLGDIWRAGDCLLEVSQPRQPCWKLARRWDIKDLPKRVIATGRTGWYFRVVQVGTITAGDEFLLEQRPCPDWTIDRANRAMYDRATPREETVALSEVAALAEAWREPLVGRIR